ncbi:hypothetical protein D3C78_1451220 [compost metagenome]
MVIGTAIGCIEMRTIVHALATMLTEQALAREIHHQLHHVRRAVDNGCIDNTTLAGLAGSKNAGQHADRQVQRTTTDVTYQSNRRRRCLSDSAAMMKSTGQCNVVIVMACGSGQWAVLTPASHAPIHQARVAALANLRAEPQTLHHSGTHAFDQGIGTLDKFQ